MCLVSSSVHQRLAYCNPQCQCRVGFGLLCQQKFERRRKAQGWPGTSCRRLGWWPRRLCLNISSCLFGGGSFFIYGFKGADAPSKVIWPTEIYNEGYRILERNEEVTSQNWMWCGLKKAVRMLLALVLRCVDAIVCYYRGFGDN
jgi:hypothetical protein